MRANQPRDAAAKPAGARSLMRGLATVRRTPQYPQHASPFQTVPRRGNHRHGPGLPTPSSAGGLRTGLGRRPRRACCQTVERRLVLERRLESTLNIVVEHAFEPRCLRSAAIWHLHNGLQQDLHCPVAKPMLRSPTKTGRKRRSESSAVKQPGGHTCWMPPRKTAAAPHVRA